jgi:DNA-binding GntR family transcriptional regulator
VRQLPRKKETADLATAELRTAILTGALPPGARLRQEELAEQLGVSRMPVRQALNVLEREGFVKTGGVHGTIVTPLDTALLKDVYEFREIVERRVASKLARNGFNASAAQSIMAMSREPAARDDVPLLIDLDIRFHRVLCEGLGNRVLTGAMHSLWDHTRRVMHISSHVTRCDEVWDEHQAILDAVERRDSNAAGKAAAHHVAYEMRRFRMLLDTLGMSASGVRVASSFASARVG